MMDYEDVPKSHQPKAIEYTSHHQNDTFIDFDLHSAFFSPFSNHGWWLYYLVELSRTLSKPSGTCIISSKV